MPNLVELGKLDVLETYFECKRCKFTAVLMQTILMHIAILNRELDLVELGRLNVCQRPILNVKNASLHLF